MKVVWQITLVFVLSASSVAAQPDSGLEKWLGPQEWKREGTDPVVSLGEKDSFDDQHIFAPCVARLDGRLRLWYCGSSGTVADRVFKLGVAELARGDREWGAVRRAGPTGSVGLPFEFGDGRHSILTPTILTENDGTAIREDGKLRMWFSSTDFHDKTGLHTLHETSSSDGVHYSPPSPALLKGLYAPTVLKDGETYRMWFTDVSKGPWVIRYAESKDGKSWTVEPQAVLKVDQPWELDRLFYPTVRKVDGMFIMWYGSYWKGQGSQKTALGFAVSRDGRQWTKSPHNPVLRPDASRPWESHYVTSQSVIRNEDGSWRMFYASRTKPPFVHKYFAIGTAAWAGDN